MLTRESVDDLKHGGFRSFIRKAFELGVQIEEILHSPRILKLEHEGTVLFCTGSSIPVMRQMGRMATVNKLATKKILSSIGIPVPKGVLAFTYEEACKKMEADRVGFPVVCKPLDGSLAKGVSWNIRSWEELSRAVAFFSEWKNEHPRATGKFLVEEMAQGDEFRVLVYGGRVLSCVQKVPASVLGDGKSSLAELIKAFNHTRLHGFEIKVDQTVQETLANEGLTLDSVIPEGRLLRLRNNSNMSDGGRCIERTKDMHPAIQALCVRAVTAVGLVYGGIDIISEDIASERSVSVILEINPNPFYNMHEKPLVEGEGIDVSRILLRSFFPGLR